MMALEYVSERTAVADFMRRLYERGLTTGVGGNISLRKGELVFITPAGVDKGRLTHENIGIVSVEGENLTPGIKLSIETDMHLSVLRNRPDISAVVHAHPTISTFFSAVNVDLIMFTSEARAVLGVPVKAPYEEVGTKELARSVSEAALKSNVILMENHGVLTVGETLFEAFVRVEVLESAAKMNWMMKSFKDFELY